ncbi:hypothetical protein SAMN05216462_0299 [Xylanibacter ruminicola]|uniref:Uncharacterized protein n=1 Tax=Xylanibacter ruminicola TaxID=839 RepID=A0A1H3XQK0_XYLRU|nr:hypothetical protein SAMN05216462_0299 [Xylanibacter ruminicola]
MVNTNVVLTMQRYNIFAAIPNLRPLALQKFVNDTFTLRKHYFWPSQTHRLQIATASHTL